jgi:hypothetical protein
MLSIGPRTFSPDRCFDETWDEGRLDGQDAATSSPPWADSRLDAFPFLDLAKAEREKPLPSVPRTGTYTDNLNEVAVHTTKPALGNVVIALGAAWPALSDEGARTLAAQFMAETGGGRYCFNWNLGNVKAGPNEPHMYLRNVWEVDTPDGASAAAARSGGLAHLATPEEIAKHGWACPLGKAIVVFEPPHAACRFRAYASLDDGIRHWVAYHERVATRDATYLDSLNSGDTAAVAHALKRAHTYTAAESDYARLLAAKKAWIDRSSGMAGNVLAGGSRGTIYT